MKALLIFKSGAFLPYDVGHYPVVFFLPKNEFRQPAPTAELTFDGSVIKFYARGAAGPYQIYEEE